jgi:hypothetical protein
MISRRRMLVTKAHLPLRHLALCLDCDECFEINDNCLSNVLIGYALLWEVRHAPTGEPS